MKALLRNPAEVSSSTNIDVEKKNSEHIDKIYTTRKMILGSWEKNERNQQGVEDGEK